MSEITFFSEDIDFELENQSAVKHWLEQVAQNHKREISELNYIYCSDNYLLEVNKTYLNHDYFTDIITFDQSEPDEECIEADIFISIDRVKENALTHKTDWHQELRRVMVHGLLHLIGFDDKTDEQKAAMRKSEDACLSLYED